MDSTEQDNMKKEFKSQPQDKKMNFHTELDLFFINSPLSRDQRAKVEIFIARAFQIGRDSKL